MSSIAGNPSLAASPALLGKLAPFLLAVVIAQAGVAWSQLAPDLVQPSFAGPVAAEEGGEEAPAPSCVGCHYGSPGEGEGSGSAEARAAHQRLAAAVRTDRLRP